MPVPVPDYLESTWRMLSGAYPNGLPDDDYHAVIDLLLTRLSFHNVAQVLSALVPEREDHYNEVSGVAGKITTVDASAREAVEDRLGRHGLVEWRAEED